MTAIDNRRLMQDIFTELSAGNLAPFVDAMAEDMQWTWDGDDGMVKNFQGAELGG